MQVTQNLPQKAPSFAMQRSTLNTACTRLQLCPHANRRTLARRDLHRLQSRMRRAPRQQLAQLGQRCAGPEKPGHLRVEPTSRPSVQALSVVAQLRVRPAFGVLGIHQAPRGPEPQLQQQPRAEPLQRHARPEAVGQGEQHRRCVPRPPVVPTEPDHRAHIGHARQLAARDGHASGLHGHCRSVRSRQVRAEAQLHPEQLAARGTELRSLNAILPALTRQLGHAGGTHGPDDVGLKTVAYFLHVVR
mmetsp:Transcript_175691/g.558004  ORF Transcript_175691/g.558004 Transcript_175691/m.558004 type:complete len:246 (+) Transcript_175691:392-1129(+)